MNKGAGVTLLRAVDDGVQDRAGGGVDQGHAARAGGRRVAQVQARGRRPAGAQGLQGVAAAVCKLRGRLEADTRAGNLIVR